MNRLNILSTILLFNVSILHAQETITTDSLDSFINNAIEEGFFPGAQIVIGNSDEVKYSKAYGYMDYSKRDSVTLTTLYDVASCTKVCASTLAVMTLVDEGRLTLDKPLSEIITLPDTVKFRDIRIEELLYHTSGFLPGAPTTASLVSSTDEDVKLVSRKKSAKNPYAFDTNYYAAKDITYNAEYISHCSGEDRIKIANNLYLDTCYHKTLDSLVYASYRAEKRGHHIYSDLSFYMIQKVVEKITHTPLDEYMQHIYDDMQLTNIGFKPLTWNKSENIAPTEYDPLFRRDTIRGVVHDELACLKGGVCGNAGLFSSAESLAQIAAMFLRGGVDYNGARIISEATLSKFTQFKRGRHRIYALGFTKVDSDKLPYTPESYGHTGYTGAYMWIDEQADIYVVMLTNRVHPTRTNKKFDGEYRGKIWEIATAIY